MKAKAAPRMLFVCDGAPLPPAWQALSWPKRARLNHLGANPPLTLRIDRPPNRLMDTLTGRALDLLRIAAYVYGADQMLSRGGDADVYGERWQRNMALAIPVIDPAFWNEREVVRRLSEMLNFLSDDRWEFAFSRAPIEAETPHLFEPGEMAGQADQVVLFSGGADSFCATIEAILRQGRRPLLVSHQPNSIVESRQSGLVEAVNRESGAWKLPHVGLVVNRRGGDAPDTSQRSRAFLFASLGAVVAHGLAISEVLLSDNGVVSINLPFTRGQFGAQATRSTHPRFITEFNALIQLAFEGNAPRVSNSLWSRTRAEALDILRNSGMEKLLQITASCAHPRGRMAAQKHCGVCSQCIDRRFGVLAAKLEAYDPCDDYEVDIFRDNIPEGKARKLTLGYYNLALRLHETEAGPRFLTQFQRIWECIPYTEGSPDQAADILTRLLQRHGASVVRVMEQQYARVGDLMACRRLPPYSLPALIRGTGSVPVSSPYVERAVFRKQGEMYTLTFEGQTINLKERDGLAYIRELLAHPGHQIPAEDLHRRLGSRTVDANSTLLGVPGAALGPGIRHRPPDAPLPDLDPQAEAEYRPRIREIAEDKTEALAREDIARLEELDREQEALQQQLRGHLALSRRSRATMDPLKKPRQAVQQAIKHARLEIQQRHAPLGSFLKNHIKTGNTCWYEPHDTVVWTL